MSKRLNKVGLYMRLSKDDEKSGESLSIENQRILITKFVKDNCGTIIDEYIDDGWSGTDFERPAIKKLLSDAKDGKIDTIVVKDLSRFGRNYIQVGQYVDYIFPAYGIRFIAISDNIDTFEKNSAAMDMMPIMNVFNEWHAANTSKKIRAVLEAKQRSGIYTNWNYPYGYRAGDDENRTAEIDVEAAEVVRRIYDLRLQGFSARIIARTLTDEGVPNPATHFTRLDGKKSERSCSPRWVPKTVTEILNNSTYIGKTTQHRTTSVSYKNHKTVKIPESEHIIKDDAHEPIISREIWDKVQEINGLHARGRVDKSNKIHSLSGLLICADCGKKLKLSTVNGVHSFVCRTYVDLGKNYCTSHRVKESTLERLVLQDIKSMLSVAELDGQRARELFFRERAKSNSKCDSEEKQLKTLKNRLFELDKLIESAFEAKVLGNMPEGVLTSLCAKYQAEKEGVQRSICEIEARLKNRNDDRLISQYTEKLNGYIKCEALTREMCLELISFIELGENTETGRKINIYYKFQIP